MTTKQPEHHRAATEVPRNSGQPLTFADGGVRKVSDFKTVDEFHPPRLKASGDTPMGRAVSLSLDLIEERIQRYREAKVHYYKPWLFVISDGAPTDHWRDAARRAHELDANDKAVIFPIGVSGADLAVLSACRETSGAASPWSSLPRTVPLALAEHAPGVEIRGR